MASPQQVLHVARAADWEHRDESHYAPSGYETEGFVHCCTPGQLPGVLDRHYRGERDLTLCTIDPDGLDATLVWENTSGGTELFPHVYGPIAMTAIVATEPISGPTDRRSSNRS